MGITRRDALAGVLWGVAAGTGGRGARGQQAPSPAAEYAAVRQYADVRALAERIARESFRDPPRVPERFAKLDYQGYYAIRSAREARLWSGADMPFEVGLFHAGGLLDRKSTRLNSSH